MKKPVMTPEEFEAKVIAGRRAQGLPDYVEDPEVLAKIAVLLTGGTAVPRKNLEPARSLSAEPKPHKLSPAELFRQRYRENTK